MQARSQIKAPECQGLPSSARRRRGGAAAATPPSQLPTSTPQEIWFTMSPAELIASLKT